MASTLKSGGFSLIEVNLAIFVISIGMLTLFSLFPAGLRQVEASQAATQETLFADYVLSSIRANARGISADEWLDRARFDAKAMLDTGVSSGSGVQTIPFGAADQYMRAEVVIDGIGDSRRSVTVWCKAGQDGPTDYRVSIGSKD